MILSASLGTGSVGDLKTVQFLKLIFFQKCGSHECVLKSEPQEILLQSVLHIRYPNGQVGYTRVRRSFPRAQQIRITEASDAMQRNPIAGLATKGTLVVANKIQSDAPNGPR